MKIAIFAPRRIIALSLEHNKVLGEKDLENIKNWGERVFAEACIKINSLRIEYQIPINGNGNGNHKDGNNNHGSTIDFRVTNLISGKSKLVEVTSSPRNKAFNYDRKLRQLENLKNCGEPFTILTLENLNSIARHL